MLWFYCNAEIGYYDDIGVRLQIGWWNNFREYTKA